MLVKPFSVVVDNLAEKLDDAEHDGLGSSPTETIEKIQMLDSSPTNHALADALARSPDGSNLRPEDGDSQVWPLFYSISLKKIADD